ncbi:tyrosine-type recombinase/integrase [Microvirga calopogonii]|uniref:tyrosine-type recombinase/integrase n=1 Tax=Microvirga calopogonii TaxID=2078013 RepID=UPI001FDFEF20|nr:tyrosine-type recombinase/integrase [Microvirga calopogonii]
MARKVVSPHVLRHTLALALLQSGVDLLTIQAWLGHAQVAMTHHYAAADVEMMSAVSTTPLSRARSRFGSRQRTRYSNRLRASDYVAA